MARHRKLENIWEATVSEWQVSWQDMREAKFTSGFLFAIICVLVVIIGNVILLIALNFWLSIFPAGEAASNASQIAVQVIVCCFLVICFVLVGALFIAIYGVKPLWHALVDTNRVRGPLFRFMLLFASGATNAITGVLAVHAMSYTPEFVQAVLLSVIPFCAQMWTYIFIPEERKRRYLSVTLIASFVFFVAGVLLSSMSSFLDLSETGRKAPWNWTLIYLASAVVFGMWCVVQRLYLDAVMFVREADAPQATPDSAAPVCRADSVNFSATQIGPVEKKAAVEDGGQCEVNTQPSPNAAHTRYQNDIHEKEEDTLSEPLLLAQREWGKQNENDFAAKAVLLLVGIVFQALVSFACVPMDAIPWFGVSPTAADAWTGFRASCDYIFKNWNNVRYGILHTLGFFMSFVGCAYLNERSPTLASVVLQLSGPVTSLMLIIVPVWDVYGAHGILGHKIGGVILLLIAGLMYHVWDQASLKELLKRQQA
ncbi:hypothetical protein TcG_00683 [Trypanosoma cruzi]|nr:hypothetical protein TcG_00683 [Trypanosoma cruzi]